MAEIKVEEYVDEALAIALTDLLDLTVDIGGGNFESQKLPYSTLLNRLKLDLGLIILNKVSKDFNDFLNPSLEKDIEILSLPAGFELVKFLIKHETSWSGGIITQAEVEVGIVGELDKYSFAPFDIFQAVAPQAFDGMNVVNAVENFNATTSIRANVRSVDANLNSLTQGNVDFFIFTQKVKK